MSQRLFRYVSLVQTFAARVVLFHNQVAVALGLSGIEFQCFRLVQLGAASTASELARECGLGKPALTAIIDRLEGAGFVTRERSNIDRRRIDIRIVASKVSKVNAQYAVYSAAMASLLEGYPEGDFKAVLRFFVDATDLMRQQINSP